MQKSELIKLATDKKFKSEFLYGFPFEYSTKESLRWLFWLTELDQWLRNKHEIDITIMIRGAGAYETHIHKNRKTPKNFNVILITPNWLEDGYISALEQGIEYSLNLIK